MQSGIVFGLIICVILANLPWISQRVFFSNFLLPVNNRFFWILLQWTVYLLISALIFGGLERYYTGKFHSQGWEFYWSNFLLFVIFSFPGFIYSLYLKCFGRSN